MTADAERVRRICSLVIDREPTTLAELEDILGFAVPRSARQPWKARAKDPLGGIDHVFTAFTGATIEAIAADPDPVLDDLGLGAPDVDLHDLATQLLGASDRADDRYRHWRRGSGELSTRRDGYLSWVRQEPDAGRRTADDETQLVANVAALLDRDITHDSIEQVFGRLRIEGRTETRSVRGASWFVGVPIQQDRPYNVMIKLDPPLACASLFAALGWHDLVIDRDPQGTISALTHEPRWYPLTTEGWLVHVAIHEPSPELELGAAFVAVSRHHDLRTHWIYLTRSMFHPQVTP